MASTKVAPRLSKAKIAGAKKAVRGTTKQGYPIKTGGKSHRKGVKVFGGGKAFALLGVPKAVKVTIGNVRNKLGFSQVELARITGYSLRSIASWESGKALSAAAKQKITETERLRLALSQVVPSDQLGEWMRTPNPAFEGQTPIQVIERGESDRIWQMIFQIDAGVAS